MVAWDQPYSFEFYEPDHGIVFGSEKGGHLSLAFELANREGVRSDTRYFVDQMNTPPRIQTSLNDFLAYRFKPYRYIEVDTDFYVYSSKFAIQEITLTNTLDNAVTLDVYPFFQHPRGIRKVNIGNDSTYFTFKHDEPMDGWGKRFELPYPDSVYNVFMVSRKPRSFGVYPSLGPLYDDPTLPKTTLSDTSLKQGGPVFMQDSSRCLQAQPEARMLVYRNDSRQEVLTQKAPQIDGDTLNVPGDGTQQLELTHFSDPPIGSGDSFTVDFLCREQQGSVTETVPEGTDSVGVDLSLSPDTYVPPPDSVELDPSQDYDLVHLTWKNREGYAYDIYRGIKANPGYFTLISDSATGNSYFDFNVEKYASQTYVLVTRDSLGNYSVHSRQVSKPMPPPPPKPAHPFFYHVTDSTQLSNEIYPYLKSVAGFQNRLRLEGGGSVALRMVRGKGWANADSLQELVQEARNLLNVDMENIPANTRTQYSVIPDVEVSQTREKVYLSAFNQLRQGIMPAEGQLNFPHLVESRDPSASKLKAGQSSDASLALLSLVMMNENRAQRIQRNYFEHQRQDGYIPYRLGPYITETVPANGQNTATAPWFNWINWNIYLDTGDQNFLQEAYAAGSDFYNFWINRRDADNDGLSEWGASAALESARERQSVIWDEVVEPPEVEALGLNTMLVKEAGALAKMADALNDSTAAGDWRTRAEERARKIRDLFWDDSDQFFYHVDREDHDFTGQQSGDLKRQEIIGFLPLWADIASDSQADALISRLSDPQAFWRENGVPSLSAEDPSYNPIGRWNGPVRIPWQYFIYRGLRNYNRDQLSRELVEKVSGAMADKLVDIHSFRSRYSPDSDWAGSANSSTSAAVIARMIWEAQGGVTPIEEETDSRKPMSYTLKQNYPNPFNPSTRISYSLPQSQHVRLTVYTITGRKVTTLVNKRQQAGQYSVQFDAGRLSSGVYMYRLKTDDFSKIRKMLLVK